MALNKKNLTNLFYIFVTTHLIIWTLVPTLTNNNLPLDTIEHLAWGSNLDWGFNKHPPMVAFVLEFFYKIFGAQDWAYYFLSQIFVIISFFVVFKLAEELLSMPPSSKLLLKILEYEGSMTQKELASKTLLPDRTVRLSMKHLMGKGYVKRKVSMQDARQKIYEITKLD